MVRIIETMSTSDGFLFDILGLMLTLFWSQPKHWENNALCLNIFDFFPLLFRRFVSFTSNQFWLGLAINHFESFESLIISMNCSIFHWSRCLVLAVGFQWDYSFILNGRWSMQQIQAKKRILNCWRCDWAHAVVISRCLRFSFLALSRIRTPTDKPHTTFNIHVCHIWKLLHHFLCDDVRIAVTVPVAKCFAEFSKETEFTRKCFDKHHIIVGNDEQIREFRQRNRLNKMQRAKSITNAANVSSRTKQLMFSLSFVTRRRPRCRRHHRSQKSF